MIKTEDQMRAWLTEHVRIDEDDCRIWAGSVSSSGVPAVVWNHKKHGARRLLLTLHGRNVEGKRVYSTCGKSLCMNLDCLLIGSQKAVVAAAAKRGVYPTGARRSLLSALGRAKTAKMPITERETVRRLRAEGHTWKAIGERYGITMGAAHHAWNNWKRASGVRF